MDRKDYEKEPIPVLDNLGDWNEQAFTDSPLVAVEENDKLDIAMQYPALGFDNATEKCLLRKEVYDMLLKAESLLPDGYKFRVWDAWRPFALQKELFVKYRAKIIKEFHLEDTPEDEKVRFMSQFVANPVDDPDLPPAHTTGGAMDVTLVGPDGKELEFGTEFDAFTDLTRAAYFETDAAKDLPDAEIIRNNRRFLYNVMTSAGFTNLPSEWWHFEYGDRNWGFMTKKPAIYRGIFALED